VLCSGVKSRKIRCNSSRCYMFNAVPSDGIFTLPQIVSQCVLSAACTAGGCAAAANLRQLVTINVFCVSDGCVSKCAASLGCLDLMYPVLITLLISCAHPDALVTSFQLQIFFALIDASEGQWVLQVPPKRQEKHMPCGTLLRSPELSQREHWRVEPSEADLGRCLCQIPNIQPPLLPLLHNRDSIVNACLEQFKKYITLRFTCTSAVKA
jgi:hypothetical protein